MWLIELLKSVPQGGKSMKEKLTKILEEILYEYNLGYEPVHDRAQKRVIEIIKENNLDENIEVE